MLKTGSMIFLSALLASCSSYYASNADKQYLNSKNGPMLVVPKPLTESNISHFYNLPPQTHDPRVSNEPPQY